MRRTPAAEALTALMLEVFRVNGDLLSEGNRLTRSLGQTSARWQVLGAIRTPQTVAAVARERGLARQSVQRTADLLAADGLVEYVDNPAHRRAKLVRLTAFGAEVLEEITRAQTAWANSLARAMPNDEEDIRQALAVLRHLRVELELAADSSTTPPSRSPHPSSKRGKRRDAHRRSDGSARRARES